MPFISRADSQQAFVECQAKPWHSTMATHLEASFHGGTNHPLFSFIAILLVLLPGFIFLSSYLIHLKRERIAGHSQSQVYFLSLGEKRILGCQVLQ